MLDLYERLKNEDGADLTGFRVIHAQVIRPQDADAAAAGPDHAILFEGFQVPADDLPG